MALASRSRGAVAGRPGLFGRRRRLSLGLVHGSADVGHDLFGLAHDLVVRGVRRLAPASATARAAVAAARRSALTLRLRPGVRLLLRLCGRFCRLWGHRGRRLTAAGCAAVCTA